MKLHFVRRRLYPRVAKHQLQLRDRHVRRADVADEFCVDQLLHLAPGLHVVGVDVGLCVRAARGHVAAGRMEIRKRPVDEEEIEIFEPQVGERLAARGDHVFLAVHVVPQLRGDPELVARNAVAHHRLERGADGVLVAVDRGAVEMPIADCRRAPDRRGDLLRRRHDRSRKCRARRPAWSRRCTVFSVELWGDRPARLRCRWCSFRGSSDSNFAARFCRPFWLRARTICVSGCSLKIR